MVESCERALFYGFCRCNWRCDFSMIRADAMAPFLRNARISLSQVKYYGRHHEIFCCIRLDVLHLNVQTSTLHLRWLRGFYDELIDICISSLVRSQDSIGRSTFQQIVPVDFENRFAKALLPFKVAIILRENLDPSSLGLSNMPTQFFAFSTGAS